MSSTTSKAAVDVTERFLVQRKVPGDRADAWETIARPWGSLEPLTARETWQRDALESTIDHRAKLRREGLFESSGRLVTGLRSFEVAGPPRDPGERGAFIGLDLVEHANDWAGAPRARLVLDPSSDWRVDDNGLAWYCRASYRRFEAAFPDGIPQRQTNLVPNGQAVARFAAGESVAIADDRLFGGLSAGTLALVAGHARPASSEFAVVYASRPSADDARRLELSITTDGRVRFRVHADADPAAIDLSSPAGVIGTHAWRLIVVRWSAGGAVEIRLNGQVLAIANVASSAVIPDAPSAVVRVGWESSSDDSTSLLLGQVVLFPKRLTDGELAAIEPRVLHKWGIS